MTDTMIRPGILLRDISAELPTHSTKRYPQRPVGNIVRQYHHHSGRAGAPGREGALNTARYVVNHREFPGAAYTHWLPFEPEIHDGALVLYRLQPDSARSWHTGKRANGHGVGVCWQGNSTSRDPSASQIEMAEALIPWLISRHPKMDGTPDCISWHSEAGRFGGKPKPACPGKGVQAWLEAYRSTMF